LKWCPDEEGNRTGYKVNVTTPLDDPLYNRTQALRTAYLS
jgi:hypothetical protein